MNAPGPDETFVYIVAGYYHNFGIRTDGTLRAWGFSVPPGNEATVPAAIQGNQVRSVAAAEKLSAAVLSDGTLYTWGEHPILNCGDDTPCNLCVESNPPSQWNIQPPPTGNDFVRVDGSGHYLVAQRANGTLNAFGIDSRCQVTNVPTAAVTKYAPGHMHGAAVMAADGALALWGRNTRGQAQKTILPCPTDCASPCPPTASTCAKLQCWRPPPDPFPTVVDVEGSYYSTVGKRADGTLFAWGQNMEGECCVIPDVVAQFSCNYYLGAAIVPPPVDNDLYANCDGSTGMPLLTVADMICFNAKYAQGDAEANCDESAAAPVLSVDDILCFHMKFALGQ